MCRGSFLFGSFLLFFLHHAIAFTQPQTASLNSCVMCSINEQQSKVEKKKTLPSLTRCMAEFVTVSTAFVAVNYLPISDIAVSALDH
jgi:hypothetical protein